jgi:DNA modification methylase
MEKHDFKYHSEVCIWKDPVIEMQRTKNHGLLYKQLRKDSSYSRQGLPDYLVIFRKWTENGDVNPVDNKTHDNFKLDKWQNYASPVWFDINQTNVLNKELARGDDDEKHICPLQLDVIERAVDLWTKPGDWVFTPFLGIGSEIYQSLLMGRNGIGIELKREYYEKAIGFCKKAESKKQDEDINLFDMEM